MLVLALTYSLSSGERKGKSLNHIKCFLYFMRGCKKIMSELNVFIYLVSEGENLGKFVRGNFLEGNTIKGDSPVPENFFTLLVISLEYLRK